MSDTDRTGNGVATTAPPLRGVLVAFLVFSLANIAAVATGSTWLATATKPFLVGLLIVWVWLACDRRPPRALVVGLAFALLGDVLLSFPGTLAFVAGMSAFLVMQLCYIRGFAGMGAWRALRATPWAIVAWAALWLVLNLAVGPMLGDLRWPMTAYSLALVAMGASAVATGDRAIGAGGLLFLVSDLLIGLRAAGIEAPLHGVLVMTTYAAAQLLISVGWVTRVRSGTADVAGAGG